MWSPSCESEATEIACTLLPSSSDTNESGTMGIGLSSGTDTLVTDLFFRLTKGELSELLEDDEELESESPDQLELTYESGTIATRDLRRGLGSTGLVSDRSELR